MNTSSITSDSFISSEHSSFRRTPALPVLSRCADHRLRRGVQPTASSFAQIAVDSLNRALTAQMNICCLSAHCFQQFVFVVTLGQHFYVTPAALRRQPAHDRG